MRLIITKDYQEMSRKAAEILIKEIKEKPNLAIGFATGSTPLGLYKELVKSYENKEITFSGVTSFNLDEYYPIKHEDEHSYHTYMFNTLFNKINIKKQNINLLNGETNNPEKECSDYEGKLEEKRIDIQILGLGINGHIAFNEPGSGKDSRTRIVELSEETINSNSRLFSKKSEVPRKALTMGIVNILQARKIILLASGKNKAEAVRHLVQEKESSQWPASFLKNHKNLIVILDRDAASLLD